MMDNAGRATRAEAALLAYIDATGDSRDANELETWIGDLLADLRHLCRFLRADFNPDAGQMNFEAECREDPRGSFVPSNDWYTIAEEERRRKRIVRRAAREGRERTAASDDSALAQEIRSLFWMPESIAEKIILLVRRGGKP